MIAKTLARSGKLLMTALVVLGSLPLLAQETVPTDTATTVVPGVYGKANEPGKIQVPLSGTATVNTATDLQVEPATIDAGLVEIGESRSYPFRLLHAGAPEAEPVQINTVALFGTQSDEFSTDFNGFVTLYPGDYIDANVIFTPKLGGQKSAGLRMGLDGITTPFVLLFEGWSRWPLTSDLSVDKVSLSFGENVQGTDPKLGVTFKNLGEGDSPAILVDGVSLSGDNPGAFSTNFSPFSINPGQSKTVTVSLKTAELGPKSAMLEITHNGNNRALHVALDGIVVEPQAIPVQFSQSILKNASTNRATAIEFGPDGRLYVGMMNGMIDVYKVTRNGKNNYSAQKEESISLVYDTTNHNDDGSVTTQFAGREMTGLYLTGTASNPIIYVASCDPRQAAGPSGTDSNLDTNSGILHKLTKSGSGWTKKDLVRGLPRSEENHAPNGLTMKNGKILLMVGGNTNMGAPSNNFAHLPEYALSAALLEIDIEAIGNNTYDLPTLDDEDRPGNPDHNDPFGGNNGKNQAMLVPNSPVQLYATGFRNAYDVLLTQKGELFSFDNGPNSGWGGEPVGNCTNKVDDGGSTTPDRLVRIVRDGYYGHPNPTRGNKSNTFNSSNPQSPMQVAARPQECQWKSSAQVGGLTTNTRSSNGMDEYTASNFGSAMKGDLLVAAFGKNIYRLDISDDGKGLDGKNVIFGGIGSTPLDLTAQGDSEIFPGTVWVVDHIDSQIRVFEPADY